MYHRPSHWLTLHWGGGHFGLFAGDANADGQATVNASDIWLVNETAVVTSQFP